MIGRFYLALLIFLSAVITSGTLFYYLVGFSLPWRILSILLGITASYFLSLRRLREAKQLNPEAKLLDPHVVERSFASAPSSQNFASRRQLTNYCLLFTVYCLPVILDLTILAILILSRTTESIRSPWEVVPPIIFLLLALSTALLLKSQSQNVIPNRSSVIPSQVEGSRPLTNCCLLFTVYCLPITLHFFTTLAVTSIVFPLGFGFDQILHQAGEKVIAATGMILPKTPYYIGQYALVTILHTITRIPIEIIDRFLVPALAAIFLPPLLLATRAGGSTLNRKKVEPQPSTQPSVIPSQVEGSRPFTHQLLITNYPLIFLLFTLPFLTLTTPLNLALLWLLFTVLIARNCHPEPSRGISLLILLLTLTTLLIHPMVGIPTFVFFLLWSFNTYQTTHTVIPSQVEGSRRTLSNRESRITNYARTSYFVLLTSATLAGSLILPAILYHLGAQFSTTKFQHSAVNILQSTFFFYRFDTIRDFVYSFNGIRVPALFALLILAFRSRESRDRPFFFAALSALLSSILLLTLTHFPNVALYENAGFATRLLIVSYIFFLPTLLLKLESVINKFSTSHSSLLITFTILLVASFYLLYPTVDDGYVVARGYTTSQHDIEAVHWIDRDAGTTPYIVLSTQSVAAAAIREFGFKKYYKLNPETKQSPLAVIPSQAEGSRQSSLFYYSIPTGGPLYQYYLKFVYHSSVIPSQPLVIPSRAEGSRRSDVGDELRAIVSDAMNLAGVSLAYVVLNRYWSNAPAIASVASHSASRVNIFPDFENVSSPSTLWIFRYDDEP